MNTLFDPSSADPLPLSARLPVSSLCSAAPSPIIRRTSADYLHAKKASGSPQASEVPYPSSYAAIM